MEPQELTNEKNELFESLKSRFAKGVKPRSILYCLFCLILGCVLLYKTFHHAAIVDQLLYSVMYVLFVIIGCVYITWYNKIAKVDNALDLLAIYDKNKKIESCVMIYWVLVMGIVSITTNLSIGVPIILMQIAPVIFMPTNKRRNEIERLRELVLQS